MNSKRKENEPGKKNQEDEKPGNDNHSSVSEPGCVYAKSGFRFFNSFEEMNNADMEEMAGFSPIQNFEQVTQLLLQFYSDELQKPMDKKIHFRR